MCRPTKPGPAALTERKGDKEGLAFLRIGEMLLDRLVNAPNSQPV